MFKKSVSTNSSCKDDKSKKSVQNINWDSVLIKELRFFTLSGTTGRFAFFALYFCWGILFKSILNWDLLPLVHVMVLLKCISIVFGTQRRCRDFHYRGTFFILAVSIDEMFSLWLDYTEVHQLSPAIIQDAPIYLWVAILSIFSFLFLIFFPGKKDKSFTLTSPLLKYPYVYFSVWFILYLCGFYFLFGKIV